MKKALILVILSMFSVYLVGCTQDEKSTVEIPDMIGWEYGDALSWSFDNDIDLEVSSSYTDDALPNTVYYQDLEPGTIVEKESVLVIEYSRGYDPEGVIVVPDFTGETEETIKQWLEEKDIGKYDFRYTFDPEVDEEIFVSYEVKKNQDREANYRKDEYIFYMSYGELVVDEIEFDNPPTIRGVNLGGWFVLERWMSPSLFSGVDGNDETAFMDQKVNAAEALEEHWDTFITEDDFIWLKNHGVTDVRIPIPWWIFGGVAEGYGIDGRDVTYHPSVLYVERAMLWAEEHGINVLLDLHTAPGCQNGFDNGGIQGVLDWPKPENVALTVEVIDQIAEHFSTFDSLWGIEVLNEPASWSIPDNVLIPYYLDAYERIREHNPTAYVVFHDAFKNWDFNLWNNFFTNNGITNAVFDMHLYQVFGDGWGDYDIFDHIRFVKTTTHNTIHRYDGIVNVVIGEWSLGLQGNVYEGLSYNSINQVRRAFAAAQMNEFEDIYGWYFWNYKIGADSHLEWDFQRLVEAGLIPNSY